MLNANILTNRCPRCRKNGIAADAELGETFCSKCGLVMQEEMLACYGLRLLPAKNRQADSSWSGEPTSPRMHNVGFAGTIGRSAVDAAGRPIAATIGNMMERLRVQDKMGPRKSQVNRRLAPILVELSRLKDRLGATDAAMDRATYLCRKAIMTGIVTDRSITGLAASATYAACREAGAMRSLNDVTAVANTNRKNITKHYRRLVEGLELRIPALDPVMCASMVAGRAGLPEKTKRLAVDILNKARISGDFAGKSPLVLAGSALYVASVKCGDNATKAAIASATDITIMSITTTIKRLERCLNL